MKRIFRIYNLNLLIMIFPFILFGCGGGGGSDSGSGVGSPASIAKTGGDGQSAEVGTLTNVSPSVLVEDSQGRPVANVMVTLELAP
jgi:hypothetical protein